MHSDTAGWWTSSRLYLSGSKDYGFLIDGRGPFPDPRSAWQPNGVHGLSRTLDHAAFLWHDLDWIAPPLTTAILYELHIGTFTTVGTFAGAIEKLNHLVELGITHVEVMPVNEFAGEYGWGYDSVGLFAPHHAYGEPEDFKRFVDACHARGLAVILDVIFNHLGPSGNYLSQFGPYFTNVYTNPWGEAINFDQGESDEVRRFFCDSAMQWLIDYHVDGLRLDAVHGIFDHSARHFLEQLSVEVEACSRELGRRFVLVAESDLNSPRLVDSRERGGYQLDATWNDDFHHALHAVLTGETHGIYMDFGTLSDLAKTMQDVYVYDGGYSRFRARSHGRKVGDLPADRFVGFIQNHDQVGNRPRGDRISQWLAPGQLRIAAAVVLMAPFIPLLFQGEEWGASTPFLYFTNYPEKELAESVRAGRAREFSAFGWRLGELSDPQSPETFERSKLRWEELDDPARCSLLEWYRALIQLRRSGPLSKDCGRTSTFPLFDEQLQWFCFARGRCLVVCNFAREPRQVALPGTKRYAPVLVSDKSIKIVDFVVHLPGLSVGIFRCETLESSGASEGPMGVFGD